METYSIDGLTITHEKQGADKYIKISYPFRFGKFSEIKSDNYTFQFNLNGEIIIEGEFKEGINSVDVSFVSDGLYVLFVENKGYKIAISN